MASPSEEIRCEGCGTLIEDDEQIGVRFTVTPKSPDGEPITGEANSLIWCDEKACMLAAIEEIGKSGIFDPPKPGEWDEVELLTDDGTIIKVTQPDLR